MYSNCSDLNYKDLSNLHLCNELLIKIPILGYENINIVSKMKMTHLFIGDFSNTFQAGTFIAGTHQTIINLNHRL
jgi:hypothetical protein